ncbi:MAG: c-type cytochrome [Paracoccus sp. (in: a-proteobacteria)]|uniref:c-type cytochrome n=1 Tax=Paracoccus sp. TaxID=267 RepID=UPI0026E0A727|nr:c-type cytochrome [Paracoccus sp. (in: a-proteobacteria)]MDO5622482.1 c-type cytochrome [Paracoccus sp. (in: a-proteobacteria)]
MTRLPCLILPLALLAAPALAQETLELREMTPELLARIDAASDTAGQQMLAGPCASCHGPDGHSAGAIPSIAGMDAIEMQRKLLAFRKDEAPATVMGRLMKGYDDQQIMALSLWFSGVEK